MSEREVTLTPAAAIDSERLSWLWRGRIPLRGLTAIAGEKGLGKSILTNARIVADVTRGALDGEMAGTPQDVLVVTAEDDWRAVVKPRLLAHGADLERVHRVTVSDGDGETVLTLPDDVTGLSDAIGRLGREVALVVVDPIGAFIPESTNSHADAPVRRVLAPLAALADRRNVAVVVVMHLTKDDSRRLLSRVSGSGAFVNAARSVLALVRDPDDPDGEQGQKRLLVHAATNWGRYAPTLALHVATHQVDTDDGYQTDVGYIVVDGQTSTTLDDLQRREDVTVGDIEESIVAVLAGGPRASREVKATVADELQCARKTVERAAVRMNERAELTIESGGFPRSTTWALAVGTDSVGTSSTTVRGPTGETTAQSQEQRFVASSGDTDAGVPAEPTQNGYRPLDDDEVERVLKEAR